MFDIWGFEFILVLCLAEDKKKLREEIRSCEDFEVKLNDICEQLKKITGATGVYISSYDYKRKRFSS